MGPTYTKCAALWQRTSLPKDRLRKNQLYLSQPSYRISNSEKLFTLIWKDLPNIQGFSQASTPNTLHSPNLDIFSFIFYSPLCWECLLSSQRQALLCTVSFPLPKYAQAFLGMLAGLRPCITHTSACAMLFTAPSVQVADVLPNTPGCCMESFLAEIVPPEKQCQISRELVLSPAQDDLYGSLCLLNSDI